MKKRSALIEITGALPLGARQSIKADYLEGRDATLRGDLETRNKRARTLGKFAVLHGIQAGVGFLCAAVNTYHAVKYGSGLAAVEAAYDGAYTAVNSAVTYTQGYLAMKLMATNTNAPPAMHRPLPNTPETITYDRNSKPAERVAVVATQAVFMATAASACHNLYQNL